MNERRERPRPCRQRHPRLDRRQPAARFGRSRVEEARAREAAAVVAVAHAVCSSGLTAISWRSAFRTMTGYCFRFHEAPAASLSADCAKRWRGGAPVLAERGVVPECECAGDEGIHVVRLARLPDRKSVV